jgi:hypothetical protein
MMCTSPLSVLDSLSQHPVLGLDFLKRLASRSSSIKTHRYGETASAEFGFLFDAQHLAYAAQAHSIPCVLEVGDRDAQLDLRPNRGTSIAPNIDPANSQVSRNPLADLLETIWGHPLILGWTTQHVTGCFTQVHVPDSLLIC